MTERRHPNVINLDEVEGKNLAHGKRFGGLDKTLAMQAGAKGVGCSWYEVPPGRSAWPRHFHCANEEALFVLEGKGTISLGDAKIDLRPGDWVTIPPGPEHAHIFVNTGTAPLRYLAFSTMHTVEVVGYPDAKKIGAMASPGLPPAKPWVRVLHKEGTEVGYYEGEPDE